MYCMEPSRALKRLRKHAGGAQHCSARATGRRAVAHCPTRHAGRAGFFPGCARGLVEQRGHRPDIEMRKGEGHLRSPRASNSGAETRDVRSPMSSQWRSQCPKKGRGASKVVRQVQAVGHVPAHRESGAGGRVSWVPARAHACWVLAKRKAPGVNASPRVPKVGLPVERSAAERGHLLRMRVEARAPRVFGLSRHHLQHS